MSTAITSRARLFAAALLGCLAACAPKRPSANPDPLPADAGPGACRLEPLATPPACAAPVSRLGSLPPASPLFADRWAEAGLSEARGWRVVLADVDGDGYPELLNIERPNGRDKQHLWRNVPNPDGGTGRFFVEATAQSGLRLNRDGGEGQTATLFTLADVDNDGDLDVFSGSYSAASVPASDKYNADPSELYLNDGSGHFTRVAASGVSQDWPRSTAAAVFLDADHDGKLDLFLGNFMKDYPTVTSWQDELYRGNGDGTFTPFTVQAGLGTPGAIGGSTPWARATYGATACDTDDNGYADLLVSAYALMPDVLWRNAGGLFTDASADSGFAMDDQPHPTEPAWRQGGNTFGAACADYDNDGDMDVFQAETVHGDYPRSQADRSRILRNTGPDGGYTFERPALAETGIDRALNGFAGDSAEQGNEGDHGAHWFDMDNDGLLDLFIEQSAYPGNHGWLYWQRDDHAFLNYTPSSGVAANLVASNGSTVGDFDRDGDLDLVTGSVHNVNGVAAPEARDQVHLYENLTPPQHAFLTVTLKGTAANRQGIGARVTVTAGCVTQVREIPGGGGTFGAQAGAFAHFGLGDAQRVDRLEVRWPTQPPHVEVFTDVAVNQFLTVTEGSPALACEGPRQ